MARSPSPRRRSRSPRRRSPSPRRRSRSPDYRRRSRSPRYDRYRASSPRGRREERDGPYREERGGRFRDDYGPRDGGRQQWGAGPRGGDDVSDDDIKADSLQDYRRLKRVKMMERNIRSIWRITPSPPPDRRHSKGESPHRENGHHHHQQQQEGTAYEHPHERQQAKHRAEREAVEEREREQREAAEAKAEAKAEADRAAAAAADAAAEAAAAAEGGQGGAGEAVEDEVVAAIRQREAALFAAWVEEQKALAAAEEAERLKQEEEEKLVGPEAPAGGLTGHADHWGTHMRPGEAQAMAAFVQSGQRIPRRGEVGLDSNQIEKFEQAGFVMSGSRHSRMNAVRIRKENQVYSAEEKAALAMYNFEENKRKEARILEDMKRLVESTLGEDVAGPPLPPS